MDWRPEGFIIYIGLDQYFRMWGSFFFQWVPLSGFALSLQSSVLNFTSIYSPKLVSLQELGQDKGYISETLFTFIFFSFLLVRFCDPYLIIIFSLILYSQLYFGMLISSFYRNMYPHMNYT